MEEYYNNNNNRSCQIPAFGSWDCYDGLPFTQCFETVHQTVPAAGFIHYTYPEEEDQDLYVAGDLYANDVLTPAMIVVPRRRPRKKLAKVEDEKENEGKAGKGWEVDNFNNKETQIRQKKPKPVDEDLYKISPDLLYAQTNKKRSSLSFFSCCGL